MIYKHILLITFLKKPVLICFAHRRRVFKYFSITQIILFTTNNLIALC